MSPLPPSRDLLTAIQTPSTTYTFANGAFDLRQSVSIGTRALVSYRYTTDGSFDLAGLDYGNGDKVDYTYDNKDRLLTETYEDGASVSYTYDNNGALATVTDSETGIKTRYYYDLTDRMVKYVETGTGYNHSVSYGYDVLNNLTGLTQIINGVTHTTGYTYDVDNRVTDISNGSVNAHYTYDSYGRVSQQTTTNNAAVVKTDTFAFQDLRTGEYTSSQVASHTIAAGGVSTTYSYLYDNNGNIISVSDGTNTTTYVYDSQNQLIRENNQARNYTYVWHYDDAGNIVKRMRFAYTTDGLENLKGTVNYTYGDSEWGDLLTGYNGRTFSYDLTGNLLSDGERTFTWKHGRQLESMTQGSSTYSFVYNADGMRIRLDLNGSPNIHYVYDGNTLIQMRMGNHTLDFTYGTNGPVSITWNGTTYYYLTNIQGDVISIVDSAGTAVVNYVYDAWGNILSGSGSLLSTLGSYNPLRYRGYVYDIMTGLYYLQSRYYDPNIGRFISADAFVSTGQGFTGNNMFAYCNNNPVNFKDDTGLLPRKNTVFINDSTGGDIHIGTTNSHDLQRINSYTKGELRKQAYDTVEKFKESNLGKFADGFLDICSGIDDIREGFGHILVPVPTIAEDLLGVGLIIYGVLEFSGGIVKIVIVVMKQ